MPHCFFCSSEASVPAYYPLISFNNKQFEYRRCTVCNLVYITPPLNGDDLQALYALDYHDEFYFNAVREYRDQKALLKKHKTTGKVLDYGCGDASFLRYLANDGYELHGAEYNPALVQKLQAKFSGIGFTTIASVLEEENNRYDVIHLGDVLEHLLNPKEIIETLRRRLTPGGVLFVEGPIEHSFHLAYVPRAVYFKVRKWLQPHRTAPMRPFHVLFADAKNQKSFFERTGYKTLHYHLFEWAWPFPSEWREAKSLKQKIEYLIAKASVASSGAVKSWGNRFYYVGTPDM